jgi:hypothetical protein
MHNVMLTENPEAPDPEMVLKQIAAPCFMVSKNSYFMGLRWLGGTLVTIVGLLVAFLALCPLGQNLWPEVEPIAQGFAGLAQRRAVAR